MDAQTKTNLEPAVTPFVGREGDLARLHVELRQARLVTVLGPPGAGKTRLAREYALRFASGYTAEGAGGVWFVDLSEAREAADVPRSVAEVLGVSLSEDRTEREMGNHIAAVLASGGATLLVLDNFEQLAPAGVPTIERWLRRSPELSLLVTSRARLGAPGELALELGGLALPGSERQAETDSERLFIERARRARSGFAPSADDREVIAEVVTRLDGLPLCIELAAARMGVLGPRQLLERLGQSLDLLRGGQGRSATLRATLDWSWQLLAPVEQSALAQLGVFHGGFSLESAEAVVDLGAFSPAPELLDVLESLRNSSLLASRTVAELGGELRFGLLDMVRTYALERLRESGARDATLARHAAHFVAAGTRWALAVEHGPESLSRLAVELPNLTAVHRVALEPEVPGPAAVERALQAALALEPVFYMRGPTAPCLALLDAAFEHDLDGVDSRLIALALKARGRALRDLGQFDEAFEALERALEIARDEGDRSLEARVLAHAAYTRTQLGQLDLALEVFDAALSAARAAKDRRSEGMLLASLAQVLLSLGRLEQAAEPLESALEIDAEVGNRYSAAAALEVRGELNRARERPDAARADFEAALAVYREFGERRHEGIALMDLGALHQMEGRPREARECFERAYVQHLEFGSRLFQAQAQAALADLEREEGRMPEARRLYESALSTARELGESALSMRLLSSLSASFSTLGRLEIAEHALNDARAASRGDELGSPLLDLAQGHLELARARRAARSGEHSTAEVCEEAARACLERARQGVPTARRSAPERIAIRLLDQALTRGPPPPSGELTPTAPRSASEVGRYELLVEIAQGGMATVWVGRQRGAGGFERVIAIKRMHRHLSSSPELVAAFMDEARIASAIRHKNVVSVHDVHESRGEQLLVMEYIDGVSLAALVAAAAGSGRKIPRAVAVHIVSQVLHGLHAAHEQCDMQGAPLGIVHRDATPHNILVGVDGVAHITDFGIAKAAGKRAETQAGVAKGKFRYMSPEQASAEELDRRTDVFALGVVSWELLTASRLFQASSDVAVVLEIVEGAYPSPRSVDPSIPPELEAIVMRALANDRNQRWPTALDFATALETWAASTGELGGESDLAAFVQELSGAEIAARRRAVSEALSNVRSTEVSRSIPPSATDMTKPDSAPAVRIASTGRWFEVWGHDRVSLQRRRALRLILEALLARRLESPGKAHTQQELLEAGWPGEKVKHEAGTLRVYNALSTLRKLGLRDVLLSRDDGYLLDPAIEFESMPEHDMG